VLIHFDPDENVASTEKVYWGVEFVEDGDVLVYGDDELSKAVAKQSVKAAAEGDLITRLVRVTVKVEPA
jgi:hypothetical protein